MHVIENNKCRANNHSTSLKFPIAQIHGRNVLGYYITVFPWLLQLQQNVWVATNTEDCKRINRTENHTLEVILISSPSFIPAHAYGIWNFSSVLSYGVSLIHNTSDYIFIPHFVWTQLTLVFCIMLFNILVVIPLDKHQIGNNTS